MKLYSALRHTPVSFAMAGLGDAQLEEAPDVVLPAIEPGDAQRALRAAELPARGPGPGDALAGAFGAYGVITNPIHDAVWIVSMPAIGIEVYGLRLIETGMFRQGERPGPPSCSFDCRGAAFRPLASKSAAFIGQFGTRIPPASEKTA